MLLGFSTWAMPNRPIDTIVSYLHSIGYDAIEIGVLPRFSTALEKMDEAERQRIARLLKDYKLKLSAISAYLDFMEQDEAKFSENSVYVQRAIDLATEWFPEPQQPIVVSGFGGQPGELETHQDQLVERLNTLGNYAQERGVVVAMEHHVGNAVETPDQVVAIMEQVDSPAIRINFDISHFNVMGIPIEESVAKVLPYAAHTHIKDESGRAPEHQYLIPGEGEFDYVHYLKVMAEHGYSGTISTEISMMVQQREVYDPLETAKRSYEVVSAAFVEAGVKRG
ncbi:MAG: sugar phosphate isomerase/epimerase [Chloroflexota bacterium]